MTSSASRATVEVTVPPLEDAWKNWLSSNSQACAACARNTVSTLAYWRRMPCSAKKKNCLASRRCASSMLPETSSAKITAALVEARARAALVPALAGVFGLVHRRGALGLELRELELLPQPVDDLVELQFDDEADLAVAGAALL